MNKVDSSKAIIANIIQLIKDYYQLRKEKKLFVSLIIQKKKFKKTTKKFKVIVNLKKL